MNFQRIIGLMKMNDFCWRGPRGALLACILLGQTQSAFANCLHGGIYRNPAFDLQFLHKASIVCDIEKDPKCEKDNRETYPEYASDPDRKLSLDQVHDKFSATGGFYCGGVPFGTANIVRKNNLLVLSAHHFYRYDGACQPTFKDFSSCYFETIPSAGKTPKKYFIKPSTLKVGTKCPTPGNAADDWAIVELKEDVKGVRAYRPINVKDLGSSSGAFDALIGLKTTTVSAMSENLKKNGQLLSPETPNICDDKIRGIQAGSKSENKAFFIANACSASPGNSGGGILLQSYSSTPSFIGIVARGKNSSMDYVPFGPTNFTSGPLLEGLFYDTLMSY